MYRLHIDTFDHGHSYFRFFIVAPPLKNGPTYPVSMAFVRLYIYMCGGYSYKRHHISTYLIGSCIFQKPKCVSGHSEQLWFLDPSPTPGNCSIQSWLDTFFITLLNEFISLCIHLPIPFLSSSTYLFISSSLSLIYLSLHLIIFTFATLMHSCFNLLLYRPSVM